MSMMFYVQQHFKETKANCFVLLESDWDDWFRYSTLYSLWYVDDQFARHRIGQVKIGQFKMNLDQRRPDIPSKFSALDDRFFSVGQSASYYEKLNELNAPEQVLSALRDVAADNGLFRAARREEVFRTSLLRDVKESAVIGEYYRLINRAALLTPYNFRYIGPAQLAKQHDPIELSFNVEPESDPPSNIHVLIGRNGIGKSFILNAMVRALAVADAPVNECGKFIDDALVDNSGNIFSGVVSVSFSAFDKFEPLRDRQVTQEGMVYAYVGLKKKGPKAGVKDIPALSREFSISARKCLNANKIARWQRALDMLESDPIFKTSKISTIADIEDEDEFLEIASYNFRNLSSGHKIVLLTITKLVELVEERTLVLLDEPEAHLHPPLLSAFIRALSDLLNNRNGLAIIATHSPVVLQEVSSSCTWLLERYHTLMTAERPNQETFAENVGVLTHRIFGLEVEEAGFYNLLRDAVYTQRPYEEIMEMYNDRIGAEGRGIVRSLIAVRERRAKM